MTLSEFVRDAQRILAASDGAQPVVLQIYDRITRDVFHGTIISIVQEESSNTTVIIAEA